MRVWIDRFCIMFAVAMVFLPLLSCAHPLRPPTRPRIFDVPLGCQRAPLPMTVAFSPAGLTYAPAFMAAGVTWARALDVPVVFVLAEEGRAADVFVTEGPAPEGKTTWAASVLSLCEADWYHHTVTYHRVYNSREAHLFSLHEAGHVLGLAHSDHPNSIMYPVIDLDRLVPGKSPAYFIQSADTLTLKQAY